MFKKQVCEIPKGFSAKDIKIESSVCTGEKTIGFYSKSQNRLICAELIETDRDIEEFYKKYGLDQCTVDS